MIEEAQVVVHETHQPDLVRDFADADGLTGEDMAKADLAQRLTRERHVGGEQRVELRALVAECPPQPPLLGGVLRSSGSAQGGEGPCETLGTRVLPTRSTP